VVSLTSTDKQVK